VEYASYNFPTDNYSNNRDKKKETTYFANQKVIRVAGKDYVRSSNQGASYILLTR
jgi:hypothetical protein